jgi:tetratricopeptide (TPR) repeat protein
MCETGYVYVTRRLIFLAVAAVLMGGCHSYRPMEVERRHYLGPLPSGEEPLTAATPHFRTSAAVRYLVLVRRGTPVAEINNRAVSLAIEGRHEAARILFREALDEGGEAAEILNNLGVARELAGDRAGAIEMFAGACRLDPGNRYFIHNFRTGVDYRPGGGS